MQSSWCAVVQQANYHIMHTTNTISIDVYVYLATYINRKAKGYHYVTLKHRPFKDYARQQLANSSWEIRDISFYAR